MTYTPYQLREEAANAEADQAAGFPIKVTVEVFAELARAHADALEELARLRARLEIDFATDGNGKRVPFPTGGPDGIACRDETIRILESALAEAERKCERLKFHADGMSDWWIGDNPPDSVVAYRAEFKE